MTEATFQGRIGRTVEDSQPWWPPRPGAREGSPDVVMIVLDDVGFAQLGCYGSDIRTPHIDGLAASGLRYANFHTTALCSPTRACLLTGRNHHSVGMSSLANWNLGFPGSRGAITHRAATLAEMLVEQGYNTFAVGKWHLTPGDEQSPAGPYDQWPLQRGFERYYGFLDAATSQWKPELTEDNHRVETPDREGYHLTEDLVDHAIGFLRAQVSADARKPFFLYLALGACHEPHHAPSPFIDGYDGVFDRGWDVCREQWLARQQEMGLVPEDTTLPARNPGVAAWSDLDERERGLFTRLQQAFAGMLEHADLQLGRLLATLDALGRRENTLVMLVSDNGASQEGTAVGTLNTMRYHNGLPDELEENLRHADDIGGPRGYSNYPLGWAMAGNTPCRFYKQNTHGGGIRDPFIVSWPARIADAGGIRTQFHHAIDVVPTVLEAIGLEAPETYRGVPQMPIEGVSMLSTFDDAHAPTRKRAQYFEMLGHRGIWADGWKAVARHTPGESFDADAWELYHLDRDFSESRDLAEVHPEKLRELVELWWTEAGRYDVLPLDDRLIERWSIPPAEGSIKTQRVHRIYRGVPHLGPEAAPDTRNVSHTITARVARSSAADEGVIVANGGSPSGYALFVQDNRLVYEYNHVGERFRVVSDEELPVGAITVRLEFVKTGELRGEARLWRDAAMIGRGPIPRTLPFSLSLEGLDVGEDRLTPVSDQYASPFRFTGELDLVEIEIGADRGRDPLGEHRSRVGRQ